MTTGEAKRDLQDMIAEDGLAFVHVDSVDMIIVCREWHGNRGFVEATNQKGREYLGDTDGAVDWIAKTFGEISEIT